MLSCIRCGSSFEDGKKFCTTCGAALVSATSSPPESQPQTGNIKVFILKNGQQAGPYEQADVEQGLRTGQYSFDDLAWHEGLSEWQPLATLPPFQQRDGMHQKKDRAEELYYDAGIRMVLRISDPDNPIDPETYNQLTDEAISLLEQSLNIGRGSEEFSTRCLLASLYMDKLDVQEYEQIRTNGIESQPDAARGLAEYEKALSIGLKNSSLFFDDLQAYSDYFYNLGNLWVQHSIYLAQNIGVNEAISYLQEKIDTLSSINMDLPHVCFIMGAHTEAIDKNISMTWYQRAVDAEDFGYETLQKYKAESQKYLEKLRAESSPPDPAVDYYNRAMAACREDQPDKAIEAFDACLCLDPAPIIALQAWFNLAVAIHNKFHFFDRDGETVSHAEMKWCSRISKCAAKVREVYETRLGHISDPQISNTLNYIYNEAKDMQNRYMVYGLMYDDPALGKVVRRDFYAVSKTSVSPLRCLADDEREQYQKAEQHMVAKRRAAGECEACGIKLGFLDKAGGKVRCKAHR